MSNNKQTTSSAYRKIALDIAKDIADGKYVEGQKLFGRSMLASHYKVSPETIRKAIYILKDVGILDSEKGSGIEVISVAEARTFLARQNELENVDTIQDEITQWAKNQAKETAEIIKKLQFIVDVAGRLKNTSPFIPYEIKIEKESLIIGKTTNEVQFWHNTGGTVIAIKRDDSIIVSPGPYATFCEGDTFYIIGNDQTYAASMKLIYG